MVMAYRKILPGEILQWGYMSDNDLDSQSMAARMDNVDSKEIDRIIDGSSPITETMSKKLGKLMQTHEKFWFNMQYNYDNAMRQQAHESTIESAMIEKAGVSSRKVKKELEQQAFILAAFSVGKIHTEIGSIHAQKIMFLIDKEVNRGKRLFRHVRYKHGPNDFDIDSILTRIEKEGFLYTKYPAGNNERKNRRYVLTPQGHAMGQEILEAMPTNAKSQIREKVEWALGMSVAKLKSEIYKKYPRMKPTQ